MCKWFFVTIDTNSHYVCVCRYSDAETVAGELNMKIIVT